MKLHFPHTPQNSLLELLNEPEFSNSLAYLVDFENHLNLRIIPKENSIELFDDYLTLSIILYSGFELNEYNELKNRANVHFICFSDIIPVMVEFQNIPIKVIDQHAWLFSIINRSERDFVSKLKHLKNLRIE
jgi:hypothetical protein